MPRNITVTLSDGSQHVYANAPDNLTPDMVTARAQKDFGQSVTALDGGRGAAKPAAPAPAPAPTGPATAANAFGLGAPPGPKGTPARAAYDAQYNQRFNAAWLAANPQVARARRIQAGGQQLSQTNSSGSGLGDSLLAGIRSVPGVNFLTAVAERYLPSAVTGNTSNASVGDIMDVLSARNNADYAKSPAGYYTGALASGAGAGKLLGGVVARGAEAGIPLVSRAANFLQGLTALKKGQTVANAAKIAASGAGWGGAEALDTNRDPVQGAGEGALGALTLGAGFKAAQVLSRPFRDVLRLSGAGQILSRLTSATSDQLASRAQAYRDATGAEPTLFELLPLADRNKILKQAVVGKDNVVEAASTAIRNRANNLGPEMSARARAILTPNRDALVNGMTTDLANARGGQNLPGDAELASRAADSPTDMSDFRDQEARAIMAPHDQTPVADSVGEILPQAPQNINGTIVMSDANPPVTAAIRSTLPARFGQGDAPVTAGDMSDMIQTLRGDLGKGGIEGRTAQAAIDHLTNELQARAPDAAAAHGQMTDAYAARSRMMEGLHEGDATRLRDQVQLASGGTSRKTARTVRNAYDTPEGAAGRTLGQGNKILSDLGGSPDEALRATVGISRNSTGRQLAQNVGVDEAAGITAAARAQDESAQALSAASSKATAGGEGGTAENLVQALSGLHPGGFITTKAHAIRKLIDMTYIPESRARTMVDMIFSQNPDMARRALKAVGNEKNGAGFQRYLAGVVGRVIGGQPGSDDPNVAGPPAPDAGIIPAAEASTPDGGADAAPAAPAAPGDDPNVPYGHAVISSLFPEAEITSDVRGPDDKLSRENPGSYHTTSQNAVDVRPIPGMTFAQYIGKINDAGYKIVEARDEQKNPIPGLTTGPHWHVVVE